MLHFLLVIAIATCTVYAEEEVCNWCENGNSECDWSFANYTRGIFTTSISGSVGGRGFPYWYPSSQSPLTNDSALLPLIPNENENITLAIIVHHGANRNADEYCSYMTNAVLNSGVNLQSTLVIAPQIYEAGDDGLDENTMIWWNENSDDGKFQQRQRKYCRRTDSIHLKKHGLPCPIALFTKHIILHQPSQNCTATLLLSLKQRDGVFY